MNTANFSIDEDTYGYMVKQENNAESDDNGSDIDSNGAAPMQIVDPLLLPTNSKRRISVGIKNESPEERALRLSKMSAYAARRLANETQEQRALRLKRMSEYAAKRLSQETSEQRAKRLARMSAYAAKRLASETPEQRQLRLTRMSAYAARRQAMKKDIMSQRSEKSINTEFASINIVKSNQS